MRATDCNGGETWWVNGETREKESSGAGPARERPLLMPLSCTVSRQRLFSPRPISSLARERFTGPDYHLRC